MQWVLVILLLFFIFYPHTQSETKISSNPDYYSPTIITNCSIAIYVIVGATHQLDPDLRGKYWEFQLPYYHGPISVHYISDGDYVTNGVKFFKPPLYENNYSDPKLCIRTFESCSHFLRMHRNYRWMFRVTTDTFINLTNLHSRIMELEMKYDPMKDLAFSYVLHEFAGHYYPHGGPGILFSNAAVKMMFQSKTRWFELCSYFAGDDTAFGQLLELNNVSLFEFSTTRHLIWWQAAENDFIENEKSYWLPICMPAFYIGDRTFPMKPVSIRDMISLHMDHVPMNNVVPLLTKARESIAFETRDRQSNYVDQQVSFHFCRLYNHPNRDLYSHKDSN